jgi:hypothetical protein
LRTREYHSIPRSGLYATHSKKKPRHGINVVGVETPVFSRKEGRIVVSLPRMVDAKGCRVDVDDGGLVVERKGVYLLELYGYYSGVEEGDDGGLVVECKGVYLLELYGYYSGVEEGVFDFRKREMVFDYSAKK